MGKNLSDNLPKIRQSIVIIIAVFLLACCFPFVYALMHGNTQAMVLGGKFLLLGFVMFGLPLIMVWHRTGYRLKHINYLAQNGLKITADTKINRCKARNYLSSVPVFMFEAKALNPLTGKIQYFHSDYLQPILLQDEYKHHIPPVMEILIDPKKPKRYFFNITPVYISVRKDESLVKTMGLLFNA